MADPLKSVGISNWLSNSALRLSLCRRSAAGEPVEGSHCTGFLWQHGEDLFLITNWHCVTGWHPILDKPLDQKWGFVPELVLAPIMFERDTGQLVKDQKVVKRRLYVTPIELRDSGRPVWLEHPIFGRRVDVVAIKLPLKIGLGELMSVPINNHEFEDLAVAVGDEAFVIGFPEKMDGGYGFPVWKRASVATEPAFDLEDQPKLLIDTATRRGMSGAPVIAVQRCTYKDKSSDIVKYGTAESFLGIYSSRIGDDEMGVQLGTVFKASVLDEIISGGVAGRGPHDGDDGNQTAATTATEGLAIFGNADRG